MSTGSYAAPWQRLARRIAWWTAQCVQWLLRRRAQFDTGLAACLTARSWRFGGSSDASADGLDRDGRGVLPDGSLAALQRMVRDASVDGSRRARHTARQLTCGASADGSRRFGGWLETGPAYYPTARLRRFGGWFATLRQMVRDGPGVLPNGSLVALRRIV